jgi:predicted ATP-dependent endonuclease of OLD family
MKIDFIHIQNFRKLKDCRIDFSEKETIFVGANNSGKTTAMDAMIKFLKKNNTFSTRDFT